MRLRHLAALALLSGLLSGCGYNTIQKQDEDVKAQWSEVLNQYQRRADLVPNLVATVKGFAAQEERVLVEVTNARAHAIQVELRLDVPDDVELTKADQTVGQKNGRPIFILTVPANGSATVRYQISPR